MTYFDKLDLCLIGVCGAWGLTFVRLDGLCQKLGNPITHFSCILYSPQKTVTIYLIFFVQNNVCAYEDLAIFCVDFVHSLYTVAKICNLVLDAFFCSYSLNFKYLKFCMLFNGTL